MDQYDLISIALILLFGFAGGTLFRGWKASPPGEETRKYTGLFAGAILCWAVGLYRIYGLIYSLRLKHSETFFGYHLRLPYWVQPALVLLPVVVLLLAAGLLLWRGKALLQGNGSKEGKRYVLTGALCVAGSVLLLAVETVSTMLFLFPM